MFDYILRGIWPHFGQLHLGVRGWLDTDFRIDSFFDFENIENWEIRCFRCMMKDLFEVYQTVLADNDLN
jgi:poly-D-alanine transfer protein DltD